MPSFILSCCTDSACDIWNWQSLWTIKTRPASWGWSRATEVIQIHEDYGIDETVPSYLSLHLLYVTDKWISVSRWGLWGMGTWMSHAYADLTAFQNNSCYRVSEVNEHLVFHSPFSPSLQMAITAREDKRKVCIQSWFTGNTGHSPAGDVLDHGLNHWLDLESTENKWGWNEVRIKNWRRHLVQTKRPFFKDFIKKASCIIRLSMGL